jgi:hypothetical protein
MAARPSRFLRRFLRTPFLVPDLSAYFVLSSHEGQAISSLAVGMIPLIVTPSVEAGFQRSCVLPLPLRVRFIKPLNRFEDCLSSQRSEERKQMNRRGNQKRFPSRRFMNQRTPSPATMPTGAVGRGSKSGLTIIRYLKTSTLKKKKGT